MEIRDRLTQILTFKQMSSSAFADFLGIQRSNMSHYLAGRNKPGVEILQKILDKFPDISADWLIMGRGEMMMQEQPDLFQNYSSIQPAPVSAQQPPVLKRVVQSKKIDRITVYFDDGTYQEFYSGIKK